jgi:hypothetical protein
LHLRAPLSDDPRHLVAVELDDGGFTLIFGIDIILKGRASRAGRAQAGAAR